jgi:hypothetical protein
MMAILILGIAWGFIKGVEKIIAKGKKGLGITLLITVPMFTVIVLFATLLEW